MEGLDAFREPESPSEAFEQAFNVPPPTNIIIQWMIDYTHWLDELI